MKHSHGIVFHLVLLIGAILFSFFPERGQAQLLSNSRALDVIQLLEKNPKQKDAKAMADSLVEWMDQSRDIVVYITGKDMQKMKDQKFAFANMMYVLYLGGMARFDLENPNLNKELQGVDKNAGMTCMCNGLEALKFSNESLSQAGYFRKLCKKYLHRKI